MKKFIILIPIYNDWKSAFRLLQNIDLQIAKWEAEQYQGGPNPGTQRQWGEAWDWANTVITA